MRRFPAIIAVCVFVLTVFVLVFASENPVSPPAPARKTPEMSTAGKVIGISEKTLKIERSLKGKVEIMEFSLEKPFPEIVLGDQIRISYLERDGQNILTRVAPATKTAVQKPKKGSATSSASKGAKAAQPGQ
jgi:hypothetical protein